MFALQPTSGARRGWTRPRTSTFAIKRAQGPSLSGLATGFVVDLLASDATRFTLWITNEGLPKALEFFGLFEPAAEDIIATAEALDELVDDLGAVGKSTEESTGSFKRFLNAAWRPIVAFWNSDLKPTLGGVC